MKHFKLLASTLILGAISLCGNSVFAATSAEQVLQCELGAYVDITPDSSAVLTSDIAPDTGNLSNPLKSIFKIQANKKQTLYLSARVSDGSMDYPAFFQDGSSKVCVLLAHKTNFAKASAINDAKQPSPNPNNNANVIAYPVTDIDISSAELGIAPVFKSDKSRYEISVTAGETTATTNIASTVVPNTYSYLDTAGTYEAIVTLTSSST